MLERRRGRGKAIKVWKQLRVIFNLGLESKGIIYFFSAVQRLCTRLIIKDIFNFSKGDEVNNGRNPRVMGNFKYYL